MPKSGLYRAAITISIAIMSVKSAKSEFEYRYQNVSRRWFFANEFCHNIYNGWLASEPRNDLEVECENTTIWIGSYTVLSPWIENYGCFQYSDAETKIRQRKRLKNSKSANCQNMCKDFLYFGLMNDTCFCFEDAITNLTSDSILKCFNNCIGTTTDYCGGTNHISIYKTVPTDKIAEDNRTELCLAAKCVRGINGTTHFYTPHACSQSLPIICDQRTTDAPGNWSYGLNECVNASGTLPWGYSQKQWFCSQTTLSKVWTGVFRQIITTSLTGYKKVKMNELYKCNSFHLISKSLKADDCNGAKPFVCKFVQKKMGVNDSQINDKNIGVNDSQTNDENFNGTQTNSTTTTPERMQIDMNGETNIGLIVGPSVIGVIITTVVILTALRCSRNKRLRKRKLIKKDKQSEYPGRPSNQQTCHEPEYSMITDTTGPQYVGVNERDIQDAEGTYGSSKDGEYDQMGGHSERKIITENNTYDHTGEIRDETGNTYDLTGNRNIRNYAQNEDDYDQAKLVLNAGKNSSYDEVRFQKI